MFNLEKYASAIYSPPFPDIPSNWRLLWREKGLIKSTWRRAKRDFLLLLTGQRLVLRSKIPSDAQRLLLIYKARPQLGDSIQELSGRVYLSAPGRTIDLFTEKVIADIYEGDPSFRRVCSSHQKLADDYDFVILMTMSWKNIALKIRQFPLLPFTVVYGFSSGVELDQLGLSCAAFSWMNGLDRPLDCSPVFNLKYSHAPEDRDRHSIAIAVGGVGSDRVYRHWSDVVALLLNRKNDDPTFKIYLIGSANGRSIADEVLQRVGGHAAVHDLVGKTSQADVFLLLKKMSLLICADGGLMHIATCAGTPLVSLFANVIHPLFRIKKHAPAFAIHAPREVSEISPEQVALLALSATTSTPKELSVQFLGAEPDYS